MPQGRKRSGCRRAVARGDSGGARACYSWILSRRVLALRRAARMSEGGGEDPGPGRSTWTRSLNSFPPRRPRSPPSEPAPPSWPFDHRDHVVSPGRDPAASLSLHAAADVASALRAQGPAGRSSEPPGSGCIQGELESHESVTSQGKSRVKVTSQDESMLTLASAATARGPGQGPPPEAALTLLVPRISDSQS